MTEIPLKQWVISKANTMHMPTRTIYTWIKRGYFNNIHLRRVNKRVVFVQIET